MIPREFGRFAISLTHLNLSRSNVSGSLPSEISHLSKLVSLDLSRNRNLILNDSNTEFQHQFLKFLLHNFTQLRHLSLAYVPIDSVLPSNLSSSSSLTFLDLSETGLRGELPHEIFILPNLKTLRLHGNHIVTGVLPQSNLSASNGSSITSLRELNLSETMLSEVLNVVGSLKSLKSLNLFFCNLSGSIPKFISNLTVCGFPLSECEKGEIPPVVQEENDSDFMDGFTWEAVLMGYGCGTILGFIIGYIMFLVGKPKWFTGIVRPQRRRGYRYKCYGRRN